MRRATQRETVDLEETLAAGWEMTGMIEMIHGSAACGPQGGR
jgi:hypothetical protein